MSELSNIQKGDDLGLEKLFVSSTIVPLTHLLSATSSRDYVEAKQHIMYNFVHQKLQQLRFSSYWRLAQHVSEWM